MSHEPTMYVEIRPIATGDNPQHLNTFLTPEEPRVDGPGADVNARFKTTKTHAFKLHEHVLRKNTLLRPLEQRDALGNAAPIVLDTFSRLYHTGAVMGNDLENAMIRAALEGVYKLEPFYDAIAEHLESGFQKSHCQSRILALALAHDLRCPSLISFMSVDIARDMKRPAHAKEWHAAIKSIPYPPTTNSHCINWLYEAHTYACAMLYGYSQPRMLLTNADDFPFDVITAGFEGVVSYNVYNILKNDDRFTQLFKMFTTGEGIERVFLETPHFYYFARVLLYGIMFGMYSGSQYHVWIPMWKRYTRVVARLGIDPAKKYNTHITAAFFNLENFLRDDLGLKDPTVSFVDHVRNNKAAFEKAAAETTSTMFDRASLIFALLDEGVHLHNDAAKGVLDADYVRVDPEIWDAIKKLDPNGFLATQEKTTNAGIDDSFASFATYFEDKMNAAKNQKGPKPELKEALTVPRKLPFTWLKHAYKYGLGIRREYYESQHARWAQSTQERSVEREYIPPCMVTTPDGKDFAELKFVNAVDAVSRIDPGTDLPQQNVRSVDNKGTWRHSVQYLVGDEFDPDEERKEQERLHEQEREQNNLFKGKTGNEAFKDAIGDAMCVETEVVHIDEKDGREYV